MIETLLLRFRDFQADTIYEHLSVLKARERVWWGWWRKEDEPARHRELAALAALVQERPIAVGLFDRSTDRFFSATVANVVTGPLGERIGTPDADATPAYYSADPAPAWFLITDLRPISRAQFIENFAPVPVSDFTFFPIRQRGVAADTDLLVTETTLPSGIVLHLSDLHFGEDYGYPNDNGPGERTLLDILRTDLGETCPEGIGLIVISGDLSSRGNANVLFDPVLPFLGELVELSGVSRDRVIIVPGNHDIPLDDYSHVTYGHEAAYNAFLTSFYGRAPAFPRLHRYALPGGRILELLPINSVRLRSPELKNIGYTSWPLYDELLRQAPYDGNSLRVAVLHHHLVPAPAEEVLDSVYAHASLSVTCDAGAVIEGLQYHGFKLVLHGHQHVPRVTRIGRGRTTRDSLDLVGLDDALYIVAGGSAGARPERLSPETPSNTYGVLSIQPGGVAVEVRRYTRAGRVATEFRTHLNA